MSVAKRLKEQDHRGEGARDLLILAVTLGIGAALGELVLLGVRRIALGHAIHLGPDVIWMAPIAEATVFLVVAVGVLLVRGFLGRWCPPFWFKLPLTALAVLSVLLVQPWLHRWVVVLLALGGGARLAAWIRLDDTSLHSLRRWAAGLALLALLVGGGSVAYRRWHESREVAKLPLAREGSPNILLLVYDTMRASSLGLYGRERNTSPELEKLAAGGTTFDRALSAAPWTLPSHASMFTGRWPHELSVGWFDGLDSRHPALAEVLAGHGYAAAGFVANTVYASYEYGLDRGFSHYEDYPVSPGQFVLSSAVGRALTNSAAFRRLTGCPEILGRKTATDVVDNFLRWVDQPRDRPWFGFLNFFDVHEPYLPPAPWDSLFGPVRRDPMAGMHFRTNSAERSQKWKLGPEAVEAELTAYEAAAAYLDSQVGRLLEELRRRGLSANTVVVVTSDHGEEFGERRVFGHGTSLNLEAVHVPLVISYPGRVPAGLRVASAVSLRDLGATLLDLAEIAGAGFPGRSLRTTWMAEPPDPSQPIFLELQAITGVPDWYPAAGRNLVSVVDGGWRYIADADGGEELYHWAIDPDEHQDLSRSEADDSLLVRLRAMARESSYLARGSTP